MSTGVDTSNDLRAEAWQVFKERQARDVDDEDRDVPAATTYGQYVWDLRYVDAPVVAFQDRDLDGDLDESYAVVYYCTDANMNVTALVNASGGNVANRYVYDPYGAPRAFGWAIQGNDILQWVPIEMGQAVPNEVLYAGYRYDPETGLYHVRNRAYAPHLGRWLQRDPAGYADGMGLYEYVYSDPMYYVDPHGLWGREVHEHLTSSLGRMAGIACATDIARHGLAPDMDPDRRPGAMGVLDIHLPSPSYASGNRKIELIAEWHFPASPDGIVYPGDQPQSVARTKVEAAIQACDYAALGEGLHVYQDSWSHQGRPQAYGNRIGHFRGAREENVWGWGKWHGIPYYGVVGTRWVSTNNTDYALWLPGTSTSTDKSNLWPEDVRALGRGTYKYLKQFKNQCPCHCPDKTKTSSGPAASDDQVDRELDRLFRGSNVIR